MIYLLIVFPLAMAAVAFALPSDRLAALAAAVGSAGAPRSWSSGLIFRTGSRSPASGWEAGCCSIPLGKLVLGFLSCSVLPLLAVCAGLSALSAERPNRVFCANLFVVQAMMTLVTLSHHLGLMWVAMEATTLATAPLLYFNHNARSLEATWKYLLIGSVGIALALLGLVLPGLRVAQVPAWNRRCSSTSSSRTLRICRRPGCTRRSCCCSSATGRRWAWRRCTPGSRTPTARRRESWARCSRAGVTSCAFLAILRVYQICRAGADAEFAREMMVFMGLLSMAVAAVFMVRQRDFKRMLAYSSVEHMGILVLGIGIGGLAVYGALLHLINNGLTKGVLFLSAGNIHRAYGSKVTDDVRGAISACRSRRRSSWPASWPITGSPPFGPFVSEFTIVNAAVGSGQYVAGGLFLLLLGMVFIGMGVTVLAVVQGNPPEQGGRPIPRQHRHRRPDHPVHGIGGASRPLCPASSGFAPARGRRIPGGKR